MTDKGRAEAAEATLAQVTQALREKVHIEPSAGAFMFATPHHYPGGDRPCDEPSHWWVRLDQLEAALAAVPMTQKLEHE